MPRTATALVASVLAAGLIAAGCGDDDEDTTTTATTTTEAGATGATGSTGPLSKQEFIAEADEICAQGDEEIEAQEGEYFGDLQQGEQPSEDQIEQFVTEVVAPSIQEQIDGLRALTPPEGDEEQITEFLDSAQTALDELEQNPAAAVGENDPFAEVAQMGKAYGFKSCAS